jgi:hypothetical protein
MWKWFWVCSSACGLGKNKETVHHLRYMLVHINRHVTSSPHFHNAELSKPHLKLTMAQSLKSRTRFSQLDFE